ncbi:uncharacterized protein CBL_07445 [Carabus blaptoides fortunei]
MSVLLQDVTDLKDRDKIVTEFIKCSKDIRIGDFPTGLEWFNVTEPLSFTKHLKGKLVILDFFTYCCINCMHILPDLKEIENEFSVEDGLVVIGVHSAKFDNEKVSSNILSAVQRYNISHPVVNDSEAFVWNNCGINCWPTLLLLGPHGNPIIMLMGEGHKEDLQLYIRNALNYYKSENEITSHTIPMQSCFYLLPELKGPLLFPGKIANYIDCENNNVEQIAISDTGNHRILVISPDGIILHQIGGTLGFKDGKFSEARFNAPQGLVFQNENVIYVADTENHAIRKINLNQGTVETVAGTGVQGIDRSGGKNGREQEISSPWDVCIYKTPDMDMSFHLPNEKVVEKEVILIAMAGTHQIWALFLDDIVWWKFKLYTKGTCVCIAGNGKEENRNNAYPHSAAFAQPSGLALCKENKEVFVADSESSSIRRLSLTDGKVTAVVGGDRSPTNLFGFGDIDGKLYEAKLQHPIGLVMSKDERSLFVADTYNHKIKKVDITTNTVSTLRVTHAANSTSTFSEPCGLCVSGDGNKLYICDTNNHAIKVAHISGDRTISKISKLDLRVNNSRKSLEFNKSTNCLLSGKTFNMNTSGGKIILNFKCNFANGFTLTVDAPQKWLVMMPNEAWSCVPNNGRSIETFDTVISVPNADVGLTHKFYIECSLVICKDNLCQPKSFVIECSVNIVDNGPVQIRQLVNVTVDANIVIT